MKYERLFTERYEGRMRGGKWFRMICPFHADTDASLDVDLKQGGIHCWSCVETGNITKLIMKLERVSESTAERIISRYVSRSVFSGRLGDEKKVIARYLDPEHTLERFVPISDQPFLKYLKFRKINKELAQLYDLRQGSIIERGWDNRIIYPIRDLEGNLCSVEGRSINGQLLRYRKWTGSQAGLGVFGIEKIKKKDWGSPLIIVEGMFDALSILSVGYSAVAMVCSEISPRQMIQLRKVTKYPIVIFDGVRRGTKIERKRVEKKVRESLAKKFNNYKVITIPFEDTDPNDLLRQGKGKLKKFMRGAYDGQI